MLSLAGASALVSGGMVGAQDAEAPEAEVVAEAASTDVPAETATTEAAAEEEAMPSASAETSDTGAEETASEGSAVSAEASAVAAVVGVDAADTPEATSVLADDEELNEVTERFSGRPVSLSGSVSYSQPVIADETPQNEQMMSYRLMTRFDLGSGLFADLSGGFNQAFVAEVDETGYELNDTSVRVGYKHSPSLDAIGLKDKTVTLRYEGGFILPTSRTSIIQDMRFAAQARATVLHNVVHKLNVGVAVDGQYRNYQYSTRELGGSNTKFVLGARLLAHETVYADNRVGAFVVSGSVGTSYRFKYAGPSSYEDAGTTFDDPVYAFEVAGLSDSDFSGARSDDAPIVQTFAWGLGLDYTPPVYDFLSLSVGMEHGQPTVINGVLNTFAFKREITQMSFSLSATY